MYLEAVCSHCEKTFTLTDGESRRRQYCSFCGAILRIRDQSSARQKSSGAEVARVAGGRETHGSLPARSADDFVSAWKLDVFATWVLVPLMCLTAGLLMAGLAPRQGRLICGMVSAVAALIASLAFLTLVMAAFADGMLPGVAAVLLPPYLLFWVLRHWSEVRGGSLLGLMAGLISLTTRLGAHLGGQFGS